MKYTLSHLTDHWHLSEYWAFLNSEMFTTAMVVIATTAIMFLFLLM